MRWPPNLTLHLIGAALLVSRGMKVLQAAPAGELGHSAAEMDGASMVTLRAYRPDDALVLLALFRDTIRRVNSRDYGPDQIRAWASDDIDSAGWADRFGGRFVAVAEVEGRPIGFADLEPDGHIDRFYVSADHQRCGIGRALLAALAAEARRLGVVRLFTEASVTARPFFERHGYQVLQEQVVVLRGVEFVNYRMEKHL